MPFVPWCPPELEVLPGKKAERIGTDYFPLKKIRWPKEFNRHCKWYENTLQVETPEGKIVPFKLYDIQKFLEWLIYQADKKRIPILIDVLKARREGISSYTQARFFRSGVDRKNVRTLSISCDQDSTDNLHEMTRFFSRGVEVDCPHCRNWFREKEEECEHCKGKKKIPLGLSIDSRTVIQFEATKSRYAHYTAGTKERTGRGVAAQQIHISEYDFAPSESFYTSVMQVTPNVYPLKVIIESTANGPEGPMNKHWDAACAGRNGAIPVFFPWFDFKKYSRPLSFEDLVNQPQAGPMHRADSWIVENRPKIEEARDRLEILGREWNGLGTSKRGAVSLSEAPGEGSVGRGNGRVRVSGAGADASSAEGREETEEGTVRPGGSGEVQGSRSEDGGRVPDHIGPGDSRFWQGIGDRYQRSGRDLFDSKRRNWHGRVILSLRGDDWRGRSERILNTLSSSRFKCPDPILTMGKAILFGYFLDSLSEYERDLIDRYDLTLEQINQLRWFKAKKCNGDEITRRREYPSRPEEAFSYPEESVLDPVTIRQWMDEAKKLAPRKVTFKLSELRYGDMAVEPVDDNLGSTLLFEEPDPRMEYAMGVDPSSGMPNGDWTVAVVLRKDTGKQVGVFRGRMDPHRAIDQIEALGMYFNCAFTGVEVNSIGMAFCRALEDRATLPMYERENPRRKEPGQLQKLIGWRTGPDTRDMLFTELRQAVREGRCQIRELETLKECMTLVVNRNEVTRNEKFEARKGCRDDGVLAHAIAILMRNRLFEVESQELEETEEKGVEYPDVVKNLIEASKQKFHKPVLTFGRQVKVISPGRVTIGGRRNVL